MFFGGFGLAEDASPSVIGEAPSGGVPSNKSAALNLSGSAVAGALRLVPTPPAAPDRRQPVLTTQLVALDFTAVGLATLVAFGVHRSIDHAGVSVGSLAAATLPVLWVVVAAVGRGYDARFVGVGSTEFSRAFRTFVNVALLLAVVSYVGRLDVSRGVLLVALPGSLVAVWVGRYLARLRLHRLRRAGHAMNRVLAVATADSVANMATAMRRDPTTGLHVIAACLPERDLGDPAVRDRLAELGITDLGAIRDVAGRAADCAARSVAVVAGDVGTEALRGISWALEGSGRDLIVSTGLAEIADQRLHVQSVAGLPLLRVDEPVFSGFRPLLKAVFDRTAAGLALMVLSPLFVVLAVLVRCTSAGPAFYRQTRIGRNGQPFRMTKFRSMHADADQHLAELADLNESADGLLFKVRDDPRVTRVGRFLRRTSLDELPQLYQILTGRMSLVGPRPPLPSEVARYGDDVRRRLLVKPGLTGLWQVSGRSDLSWADSVRLDLHYVENWSLGLDMVVLLKTARAVMRPEGAY